MPNEQSLKDYIYTSILQDIVNSEYTPNQIITEKEIIQKYNCSRSPVREALISLCGDNVLRNIPRCGYQVVHITLEDIEDIQRYRLVLECGMLRFFYNTITKDQVNRLKKAMSILRRAYAQYYHDKWDISIPSMQYYVDTHHHINLIQALEEHDLDRATKILYDDLNEFCGVRV